MVKKPERDTGNPMPVSTFCKQQLLQSQRYLEQRDLLAALLKDNKQYSHTDVKTLIDDFMKGKVK